MAYAGMRVALSKVMQKPTKKPLVLKQDSQLGGQLKALTSKELGKVVGGIDIKPLGPGTGI